MKSLVGSVVAERTPGAVDAAGERGLGDDPAIPDRLDQFILADDPVMVAHQMNDEIEHLRLDMNGLAKPAQLLLAEVDLEFGKSVFHYHAPHPIGSFVRSNEPNAAKTTASGGKTKVF